MGCATCEGVEADIRMPCAVCVLNDNDSSERRVRHCDSCAAYICEKHWNDPIARARAFTKQTVNKIKKAVTGKKKTDETPEIPI